ncbi:MAG: hypothetical protein JEZ03_09040 [Bacteroidales bacterium]|nr:hypothetical protein [Bacteroidales bacterium]
MIKKYSLLFVLVASLFQAVAQFETDTTQQDYNNYEDDKGLAPSGCTWCGSNNIWLARDAGAIGDFNIIGGSMSLCVGYDNGTKGAYSSAMGKLNRVDGATSFAFGHSNSAEADRTFVFGQESRATAPGAFAGGYKCIASSVAGIALGTESEATGFSRAIAIGNFAKASGTNSMAIGSDVEARSSKNMVIGCGYDGNYPLLNSKQYSLSIGFKSQYPTLFVSESPSKTTTGKIGIGTDTPTTKLHIKSDATEQAIMYLQPTNFTSGKYAEVRLGNTSHYIRGEYSNGMTIYDSKNIKLMSSRVGINTTSPSATLHIKASEGNASLLLEPFYSNSPSDGATITLLNNNHYIKTNVSEGTKFYDNTRFSFEGSTVHLGQLGASTNLSLLVNGKSEFKNEVKFTSLANSDTEMILTTNENGVLSLKKMNKLIATQNIELRGFYLSGDGDDEGVFVANNGNVGIGHKNPGSLLHLSKNGAVDARVSSTSASSSRVWTCNTYNALGFGVDETGKGHIYQNFNSPSSVMSFSQNKVAIGDATTMPGDYKLYVAGGIIAEKVRVRLQGEWSDYVFEEDYNLLSLSEIEHFVKQNKHLPGVPSALQVEEEGIDLAEMNAVLLKKIEELTLLMIELEKKVNNLKDVK